MSYHVLAIDIEFPYCLQSPNSTRHDFFSPIIVRVLHFTYFGELLSFYFHSFYISLFDI